ncbi:MAG: hypothetical protein WBF58_01820, partial [Xanthobacteraceae bacterium]
QNIAPQAKPAESEPTLAATMQYIQEKLSDQGKVGWAETFSNRPGWTQRQLISVSDVMADPAACTLYSTETVDISFDLPQGKTFTIGGKPATADDLRTHVVELDTTSFKQIEKVTVERYQDIANQVFVDAAHPEITVTVMPPTFYVKLWASSAVFSVHTSTLKGSQEPVEKDVASKTNGLTFRDEDTANHFAKAIIHAMELCGASAPKKDPF